MTATPDIAAIRFGFGLTRGVEPPAGPNALLDDLRTAEPVPARLDGMRSVERIRTELAAFRATEKDPEARKALARELQVKLAADRQTRILAAVETPCPFFERLVAFWSNHAAVSAQNLIAGWIGPYEVEAIRPYVMGSFADMLVATSLHPTMMAYLNQRTSVGPNSPLGLKAGVGLNENLAREILELHSLGVAGGYTQEDVLALARILTGWTIRPNSGEAGFMPGRAEPGPKRLLGRDYAVEGAAAGDAEEALRDLARHPATARHVALKLCRHFVADDPPEDAVAALAAAYVESDGWLPAVYEALVHMPAAWERFGEKVKSPLDLLVSALRALGPAEAALEDPDPDHPGRNSPFTVDALRAMQQPLWAPPQPEGWPDRASDWLGGSNLASRLQWLRQASARLGRTFEPQDFASLALGSALRQETLATIASAPTKAQGLFLALASPEFNRR